eukprot:6946018-Pyramimonas_sp.AAC.1
MPNSHISKKDVSAVYLPTLGARPRSQRGKEVRILVGPHARAAQAGSCDPDAPGDDGAEEACCCIRDIIIAILIISSSLRPWRGWRITSDTLW